MGDGVQGWKMEIKNVGGKGRREGKEGRQWGEGNGREREKN